MPCGAGERPLVYSLLPTVLFYQNPHDTEADSSSVADLMTSFLLLEVPMKYTTRFFYPTNFKWHAWNYLSPLSRFYHCSIFILFDLFRECRIDHDTYIFRHFPLTGTWCFPSGTLGITVLVWFVYQKLCITDEFSVTSKTRGGPVARKLLG